MPSWARRTRAGMWRPSPAWSGSWPLTLSAARTRPAESRGHRYRTQAFQFLADQRIAVDRGRRTISIRAPGRFRLGVKRPGRCHPDGASWSRAAAPAHGGGEGGRRAPREQRHRHDALGGHLGHIDHVMSFQHRGRAMWIRSVTCSMKGRVTSQTSIEDDRKTRAPGPSASGEPFAAGIAQGLQVSRNAGRRRESCLPSAPLLRSFRVSRPKAQITERPKTRQNSRQRSALAAGPWSILLRGGRGRISLDSNRDI